MTDKFPFAFDMNAMTDMFKAPNFDKMFPADMPNFDFKAFQDAQQKNVTALVDANKTAIEGYKALYTRQKALFDAALAESKDRVAEYQGQPINAETATQNVELAKTAFEKALADIKEMTEMAQTANADAFQIIKARADEMMVEIQAATNKAA